VARRGRRIDLNVVVLPARDSAPAPDPVVVLAGGPGQGAAQLAAALDPELMTLRRKRDVVLVDQRGTGRSNPLHCVDGFAALAGGPTAAAACAADLAPRADVRQYTTSVAVDDLDEVVTALGYARINLLGVSYGTRVAEHYLRRHPRRVRTVTLRAVVPPGFNIPLDGARTAERALRSALADCAVDAPCAAAYPHLEAALDTVRARVARAPVRVRTAVPRRADSVDVVIDGDLLAQTLYALLLTVPSRQQLPLLLHRAAANGVETLAPIAAQVRAAVYGSIPVGMYLAVVCSEDVPRLTPGDRAELARAFGRLSAGVVAGCRRWPRGTVARADHRPVPWPGPALLLSGEADPATSVEAADAVARRWPASRHVVLPATAHGPLFPGCTPDVVAAFVERASTAGLDAACVRALRWPAFVVAPRR
jgi:pimeloyl-ACP methyl ester carboxylesterase